MSWDVGSRNRLNKRVKIVSLRSNDSNDTVKKSWKIRSDNRNGGSGSFKSSGTKVKRINIGQEGSERMSDKKREFNGKRVYADRETRVDARSNGRAESSRMKGFSGKRHSPVGDNVVVKASERMSDKKTEFNGKRVYADRETRVDARSNGRAESSRMKGFSGKRHSPVGDNVVVKAKDRSVSSRTMWGSDKLKGANSETEPSSRKARSVVRSERAFDVTWEKKSLDVSPSSSNRKKGRVKKSVGEDLEDVGERPKKKKRVIRIDPYDISNKRLDDGIENNEEKKQDPEEKAEISKNAQFRAIQPSPSILSYVEDNLLGRRRLIELRRAGYNTELSAPLDNIPLSTSSERERIEENVFRNKLTFFAAAKVSSSFPPPELPEIAFAGRSNVGKSSLLNALTRQWGVVRTSDKPGLTQTINFFNLGSKICLVDLPGYGFAYAKEEVKDAWEELVKEYVSTRTGLKRVCLLIDTKWGMKPRDQELIDLMERAQTKYQIVLTKTDVVFPIDVARRAMQIEESLKTHKSVVQPVMIVSSQSGAGIRSLRTVLAKIGRFAKF